MRQTIPALAAALLLVAGVGCDEDAGIANPSMAVVAGEWEARGDHGIFLYRTGPFTTDVPAMGGYVQLSLRAEGTVFGRLFVPGREGDDLDVDFDGTWKLDHIDDFDEDVAVDIETAAQVFLRDVQLEVASASRLESETTFAGGENVLLVLVRH